MIPPWAGHCQRVLAMPLKRFERGPVEFLTSEETTALPKAPDATTWLGRRDRTLLQVAGQTGLRNSELTKLRREDVQLGAGAHVRCLGKGRKARCTPLRSDVTAHLSKWLAEHPGADSSGLSNSNGQSHELGRAAAIGRSAYKSRRGNVSLPPEKKGDAPHAAPYVRHEPSAPRGGYYGDRTLVGTRVNRNNANVSPC
jgi:integrase/recombinase XerD